MQHGWWTSNTCRYCLAVTVAIYLRLCVVFNCRLRNLFQFTTSLVLMVSVDLVEECCRLCVLKTMKEKGAWKEAWDDACVLQKFLMSGWWWSNLVIESLFQPKEAQNVKRIPNKQTKGSPSNFAKRRYVLLPFFLPLFYWKKIEGESPQIARQWKEDEIFHFDRTRRGRRHSSLPFFFFFGHESL